MIERNDPRLVFIKLEDKDKIVSGYYKVVINSWWSIDDAHGLVLWKDKTMRVAVPQCNQNEFIAKRITTATYPWAKCLFIDKVCIPLDLNDLLWEYRN